MKINNKTSSFLKFLTDVGKKYWPKISRYTATQRILGWETNTWRMLLVLLVKISCSNTIETLVINVLFATTITMSRNIVGIDAKDEKLRTIIKGTVNFS